MANYIEYELEDGATILIQAVNSTEQGIVQASGDGHTVTKAVKSFREALADIKESAAIFADEMSVLQVDEMEVCFGITATGELGNFAVGKVGLEANYQVTLKWSHPVRK
jgi:prophage DNA circulation protein